MAETTHDPTIPKVFVVLPVYSAVQPEAVDALLGLAFHLGVLYAEGKATFQSHVIPRTLIGEARNYAVHCAQDAQADYLLFLDDDMLFPIDLWERLSGWNQEIVSIFAFKRRPPYEPVPMDWTLDRHFYSIEEWPTSGLREVVLSGCAGMLIKMSVFEKIPQPYFLFYKTPTATISEDAWFCLQARKVGIKTYVDTTLLVPHLADPMGVGLLEYQAYRQWTTMQAEGEQPVVEQGDAAGDITIPPEPYLDQGTELLSVLPSLIPTNGKMAHLPDPTQDTEAVYA